MSENGASIAVRPAIRSVIIVGAGLAGLGAARAPVERNYDVVVLEGRDRVGGRCHTEGGLDKGAHWIHTTDGNPITSVARELGVETLFVGGDSSYTGGWEYIVLHRSNGVALSGEEKLHSILFADEVHEELDSFRRQCMDAGENDLSLREAVTRLLAERELDVDDKCSLDWHLAVLARDDCAAGDENLSLFWWDDGYEVYGYGDSVFMKGYGALIDALAQRVDVRLDHIVEKIEYGVTDGAPVRVTTNRGVFEADAAIVTVPLGVLKADALAFDPPLPDRKLDVIRRLGMGNLTKVNLRFDAPFWPRQQYVFGCLVDPIEEHPTMIINAWKTHKIPALQMLIGGDRGREMERWPEPRLRSWAITTLRRVFGEQAIEPIEVSTTQWDRDPFSYGSYCYIAVGSKPADMDVLAEPVDSRLFFAGEATNRHHWASTHGAYASGLREAARITDDPSILPQRHFTENRRWRAMMMRASRFFNVLSTTVSGSELRGRLEVLAESTVFGAVPTHELEVLAMMFQPVEFEDATVICRAGDPAREIYAVADGVVEVRPDDDTLIRILQRGDVVGEYGMFGDGRRTATLVARGTVHALALDYQRFQRYLLAFPESALALLKVTVDQLLERNAMLRHRDH